MFFRAPTSVLIAVLLFFFTSCAQGPGSGIPTSPDSPDIHPAQSPSVGTLEPGHNLLGYWNITVDSEALTCEAAPLRIGELHLNVLTWLEYGPCTDCLKIKNFEKLPNKNLQFDIELTHPFTQPNLSGFDVRGIAMFGGDFDFPAMGVTASSILEDNPELLDPDGHTTLYNPFTVNNGLQGYLKGKMAPDFAAPNTNLNAFKVFYSNSNRRYFLAGDTLTSDTPYVISSPLTVFTFGYAIDASWDTPTTPITVPDSFPITANSLEAYKIETGLNNPLALTGGSTAILTIDVYDWQGAGTIDAVHIEGPYFWDGLIEATEDTGGPGTKRFSCEIVNDYGYVDQGNYPVAVRVLDTASVTTPGTLIDNICYKVIQVPVALNHPPICAAEVSNNEPDPGEEITFTDTSTDLEGPGDLDISEWDWDNNGSWDDEGFEITHTFNDPGVYYVNHRITDKSGSVDELNEPLIIDVGMFITLQEDLDNKPIGINYHYRSMDHEYDSGGIIDVEDPDGPWDFTTIGLTVGPNWMRVLDDSDIEVSGFVNDFNSATSLFVKFEDMFDPFFPILYQAENHYFTSEKLYVYGFHDPYVIGSSPFGPPDTIDSLAIPYPLTIDTDYSFDINEPGFILNYSVKAIGQGDVTVPYDGGTTYGCLLVRYRFSVSAADPVNGATLNFAFISDNGMVVANVIAVNDPPSYNWNTSTNKIDSDGMTLFQALDTIEQD